MQSIVVWAFLLGVAALIVRAIAEWRARAVATRAALEIELRLIDKLDSAEAVPTTSQAPTDGLRVELFGSGQVVNVEMKDGQAVGMTIGDKVFRLASS